MFLTDICLAGCINKLPYSWWLSSCRSSVAGRLSRRWKGHFEVLLSRSFALLATTLSQNLLWENFLPVFQGVLTACEVVLSGVHGCCLSCQMVGEVFFSC